MPDFSPEDDPKSHPVFASGPIGRLHGRAVEHAKRFAWALTIVGSMGSVLAGFAGYWSFYRNASDLIRNPSEISSLNPGSKKLPWMSVAIAPFNDMSPGKDTLAATLTETLVTELSRFSNFVVKKVPVEDQETASPELGSKLGVRYLLRGSVERSGNLVRINAQLIDLKTSTNVWTDKVEDSDNDRFKLQDFVAARLANILNIEMVRAASARLESEHASSLDAEDYALLGRNILRARLRTPDAIQEAQSLFRKSLRIKPDNLDALVGLSVALYFEVVSFPGPDNDAKAEQADKFADKAIQIDPASADAHMAKGLALVYYNRISESGEQAELAAKINPSLSQAYVLMASDRFRQGKFQEAIDAVKYAMSINPIDQRLLQSFITIGNAYIGLKDYDSAVLWLQRMIAANAQMWQGHAGLAAAYALQNKIQPARISSAEARRLNPLFTVASYRDSLHMESQADNAEFLERVSKALRDAGAPETAPASMTP